MLRFLFRPSLVFVLVAIVPHLIMLAELNHPFWRRDRIPYMSNPP